MATSLSQSSILLIDDFQSMRSMLRGFLKNMGVSNIDQAGDAKEALAQLASKKYHIVICDYSLGAGQNGQQILEAAKHKNYIGYSTIWVMVTAEKTMDMFMGAAETKPDDYLLKPITEALLDARLNKLIEKKRALEPIESAVKAKDYARGIALCDEQLKTHSSSTQEIQRIKSELLISMGDYPAAKAFFENILSVRSMPWAKTGLGKVHFLMKDYARAREIFQEVLEENRMHLEAADWLSKTYDVLGDLEQAQNVLARAMEISPNALLRQKSLADAAYKNGALDLAQSSYEKAIKLGEYSVYKSASPYAGLAKTLASKDSPDEALTVLDRSRQQFGNDPEAVLQMSIAEGLTYQKMGLSGKAEAALAVAEEIMRHQSANNHTALAMEMADTLFKLGRKDKACDLLQNVVKNNHENTDVIKLVEGAFTKAGMAQEGSELIRKSSDEVIAINNQGVLLAHDGKFEEAIDLLRQALHNLPNNDLMIMNLCGMMIGMMARNGKNDGLIVEARELLERVRRINPLNKKLGSYTTHLNKLAAA